MNVRSIATAVCPAILGPAFSRLEASPLGKRLAGGVFWLAAGTVVSRGLMLAASVVVARLLGTRVYGEMGMIQSTVGMLGVFAGFGLGLTATKHVAEYRTTDPDRAGRILGLSSLMAILTGGAMALGLAICAPWLAEHAINAPHLAIPLRIGALTLFFSAVIGAQTGALSGFEAFRIVAHVNFYSGIASFPILVGGAYFGGLNGAVWGMAISLGVTFALNSAAVRSQAAGSGVPLTFRQCHHELPVLWRFSVPAVLAASMTAPVMWACAALLVNRPDGYSEMGILNAAIQWRAAVLFLPAMLAQVALPLLSTLNQESARTRYRRVLRLNLLLNAGLTLAVVLPLVAASHLILAAYGPGFSAGTTTFRVLLLTAVLMAVNAVAGSAITSKGRMWAGLAFNTVWAAVTLASSAVFIRYGFGALGVACAILLAYSIHTAVQIVYLNLIHRHSSSWEATPA